MMDCYKISRKEFEERCPFPLEIVRDHAEVNRVAARRIVDLIRENNKRQQETTLILPVGPLLFEPLAKLCNQERVLLDKLTIFMMDEYLEPDGTPVPESHPLSFRRFMSDSFVSLLNSDLRFARNNVIFPLPSNLEHVSRRILELGGVNLCFAGVGITGHIAFNDPPEPQETEKDLEWLRNSSARIVTINRESCAQMAIGGTHGNWSIIPRRACTLGMKEIMASRKICLVGMRAWHAGTVRRALFGPVSADCPASLLQEHRNVEVLLTELAARSPVVRITLDTGEEP